jgi:type 1 glutamine amidotransferase
VRRRHVLAALAIVAMLAAGAGAAAIAGAFSAPSKSTQARQGVARATRAAKQRRTILVLTQTLGYHHASIPDAVAALKRFGAVDRRLRFRFLPGAQALNASSLHGAAGVVFLLTTGDLPLSPAGKLELIRYVQRGGALIGFHSATDTFHHWPAYIALIGGEFVHHALPSTRRVIVEDRANPATHTLPASFRIHEEFYEFRHDPRRHAHVLVRLDTGPGGPDRPLVWCRRAGQGRVFYDALGHFPQTWRDRRQLEMALGGIEWAVSVEPGRC